MASIFNLPKPHTIHPHYAVEIDRAWVDKIPFASITGLPGSIDLASRTLPTINGTVDYRATQRGMASYTGGVSNGLVWASAKPVPSIFATGISLMILANPTSVATIQRPFFLGDENPVPSNQYNQVNLLFNSTRSGTASAGLFSAFEYNFGFQGSAESTAGVVDGEHHVFIATRPSGFGTFSLYCDGINVTNSTGSANGIVLTDGCRVHCHPSGSQGYAGDIILAVAFNFQLSATQAQSLSANPWQIFRPMTRRLYIGDGGGASSYTITPSGGVVFSGTNPFLKTKIFLPSGGVTLAGSATTSKTKIFESTGNITLGGSATLIKSKIINPDGGITLSGTAALSGENTYVITPSGGVTLSGAATIVKTRIQIPTGGIVFSGSAPIDSNTVLTVATTQMLLTGVGK